MLRRVAYLIVRLLGDRNLLSNHKQLCFLQEIQRSSSEINRVICQNKMDALFEEDAGPIEYQMETDTLEDEEITQEDAWVVIDKYFLERGSFNFEQIIDYSSKRLCSWQHLET